MHDAIPLSREQLRWRCPEEYFSFLTTDQLPENQDVLGQPRALEAVQFGIHIRDDRYNIYVLGPSGLGKRTVVWQLLEPRAAREKVPCDWCYIHNFEMMQRPQALCLPPGRGGPFRVAMQQWIDDLATTIPATLASDSHRHRIQQIEAEIERRHQREFQDTAKKAQENHLQLLRTPNGFMLAPVRNGAALSPEEFEQLPEEEQKAIDAAVEALQEDLRRLVEQVPEMRKEARDRIRELNQEAARLAIRHLMDNLKEQFRDLPEVLTFLARVEQDVVDRVDEFEEADEGAQVTLFPGSRRPESEFGEYEVNLLVDSAGRTGAPVVYEDHPTYHNLFGRIEHESQMGALVTDFRLITPGALHRANGGYLILDAWRLLSQPFAWDALKRALSLRQIKIEPLGEVLSLVSTVSLQPEPIPLNVKIILLGDRELYYLLMHYDPDFAELFKVAADFDEKMPATPENCRSYASFLGNLARRESHRPLTRAGVSYLIEQSARLAGDREKLSLHMRSMTDLLREADYWAEQAESRTITAEHVRTALEKQVFRADRVRQRLQEEISRGTILIDTEGTAVGQVNGLSVIDMGNFAFGQPSRITATARIGKGEIVDIEREVKLGGAIHSKGVLILASWLSAHYAMDEPLALSASLVFEQSYGQVDGDSASVAELISLLSAISQVPVRQDVAMTGSLNQHGGVQAIGGVNEKIEGFFDVCQARGLTGSQGVLIPAANQKNLMLREDVVAAADSGNFHVYVVGTVDEALRLMTNIPVEPTLPDGTFPTGSFHDLVSQRLRTWARTARQSRQLRDDTESIDRSASSGHSE
jgi:lon-related putative ATP-dependent protease